MSEDEKSEEAARWTACIDAVERATQALVQAVQEHRDNRVDSNDLRGRTLAAKAMLEATLAVGEGHASPLDALVAVLDGYGGGWDQSEDRAQAVVALSRAVSDAVLHAAAPLGKINMEAKDALERLREGKPPVSLCSPLEDEEAWKERAGALSEVVDVLGWWVDASVRVEAQAPLLDGVVRSAALKIGGRHSIVTIRHTARGSVVAVKGFESAPEDDRVREVRCASLEEAWGLFEAEVMLCVQSAARWEQGLWRIFCGAETWVASEDLPLEHEGVSRAGGRVEEDGASILLYRPGKARTHWLRSEEVGAPSSPSREGVPARRRSVEAWLRLVLSGEVETDAYGPWREADQKAWVEHLRLKRPVQEGERGGFVGYGATPYFNPLYTLTAKGRLERVAEGAVLDPVEIHMCRHLGALLRSVRGLQAVNTAEVDLRRYALVEEEDALTLCPEIWTRRLTTCTVKHLSGASRLAGVPGEAGAGEGNDCAMQARKDAFVHRLAAAFFGGARPFDTEEVVGAMHATVGALLLAHPDTGLGCPVEEGGCGVQASEADYALWDLLTRLDSEGQRLPMLEADEGEGVWSQEVMGCDARDVKRRVTISIDGVDYGVPGAARWGIGDRGANDAMMDLLFEVERALDASLERRGVVWESVEESIDGGEALHGGNFAAVWWAEEVALRREHGLVGDLADGVGDEDEVDEGEEEEEEEG